MWSRAASKAATPSYACRGELAADAAADRVLAEFSAAGQGRDESGAAEIRYCGWGALTAITIPPRERWSGRIRRTRFGLRLPGVPRDVDTAWRTLFLYHYMCRRSYLGYLALADIGRRCVAERGRDVGMCGAALYDGGRCASWGWVFGAGLFPAPLSRCSRFT